MARPRNQAGRRRDLVAAAGRVIVDRGVAGLRVRDVADEAHVSPGLVTYYYPGLDDLVVDVHADAVRRFDTARREAIRSLDDPVAQLTELARLGVPESPDDLLCRVLYELHVHGGRSPAHAALMSDLWEREVALYEEVLGRGVERGSFTLRASVRQVAETVVALEDAVGLHVVTGNRAIGVGSARDLVLGLLERETGRRLDPGVALNRAGSTSS